MQCKLLWLYKDRLGPSGAAGRGSRFICDSAASACTLGFLWITTGWDSEAVRLSACVPNAEQTSISSCWSCLCTSLSSTPCLTFEFLGALLLHLSKGSESEKFVCSRLRVMWSWKATEVITNLLLALDVKPCKIWYYYQCCFHRKWCIGILSNLCKAENVDFIIISDQV